MTHGFAASQQPGPRLEDLVAGLRTQECVHDARLVTQPQGVTVFVVPSAAGVLALRRRGKRYLVAAWERFLQRSGLVDQPRLDWRLAEELPPPGREASLHAAGPIRLPLISDLTCDSEAQSLDCRLVIPYDLEVFQGHFPSAPILPAVTQVGWAIDLARAHQRLTGRVEAISTAKFRRLVQPGMSLALHLEHDPGLRQLRFSYTTGESVVSTGRIQFGAADD